MSPAAGHHSTDHRRGVGRTVRMGAAGMDRALAADGDRRGRLRLSGASRSFGRRPVLHDIELELAPGDRVAVTGPNGVGKTTLLRLATGQLRATSGSVEKDGTSVLLPAGRRGLATVAHDAPAYAELTLREHITWWCRLHGASVDADAELADAGLRRIAGHHVAELSRGQRQRLAIATALAPRPDLVVLDEPATALDAEGQAWLIERLRRSDATLLVAVHDTAFAHAIGARIMALQRGRLLGVPGAEEAAP